MRRFQMRCPGVSVRTAVLSVVALAALIVVACGGTDEVVREVEVEKIVTQEVVKEVVKEVPVTQEVVKEVEVEVVRTVVATPTAGPAMSKTGTIPGSTLTVALESAGGETTEPRSGLPVYGCRPGCLAMKDDFFLIDPVGNLMPHVVANWDFGADTKSWTLEMQEGIQFFNGREATIDDFAFSIYEGYATRPCQIPGPYCSETQDPRQGYALYNDPYYFSTHEIVDETTMTIQFEKPTVGLALMTLTTNLDPRGLYSEKEVKELGWEEWLKDPILSGAYMTTKSIPGERKELEVHRNWFKDPPPDWERMLLLTVPEGATRIAMMASGQADVAALSAVTLPQALKFDNLYIIEQPSTVHTQLFFTNLFRPGDPGYDADYPFLDPRVREAFNIAIDRDLIVERIYAGRSIRQDAPLLAPGMIGWEHPIVQDMRNNPIEYNPVKARQLLEEANFPMDLTVKMIMGTFIISGAPELADLNEALLTQLRQNLGLDIVLEKGDLSQILAPHRNEREAIEYHIYAGERMSTEPVITTRSTYFYSDPGHNWNLPISDPIKALVDEMLTLTDPVRHGELSAQLSKHLRDNWSHIPIAANPLFFAAQRDGIAGWPLTIGAPWPHYFEYIRAKR
jgi:ABC-type transport system substrate-binding protein